MQINSNSLRRDAVFLSTTKLVGVTVPSEGTGVWLLHISLPPNGKAVRALGPLLLKEVAKSDAPARWLSMMRERGENSRHA